MKIINVIPALLLTSLTIACESKTTLKDSQPENIVSIERDSLSYIFTIVKEGVWNVYQGNSTNTIRWDEPIKLHGDTSPTLSIPCQYPDNRLFFAITNPNANDTLYLSEKHIPMQGTPNFRELGGIVNKDGKPLKWGYFFRSGSLENLTDNDLIYFKDLGIRSVIDLRSDKEVAKAPDRLPDSTIKWQQVQIMNPADMTNTMLGYDKLTPELASQFLVESNKNFVLNIKRFQPIVDALQSGEPFLFHCTAGKDRTGMSAALILTALNVDREVIMSDYLLTNKYTIPYYEANKDKMLALGIDEDVIKELGGVKREYLQAAFNSIDSIYGSSHAMLEKEFGITSEKQKELIEKYTY